MPTSAERIRDRLLSKIPEGFAIRRDSESDLYKLITAIAKEFGRVNDLTTEFLGDAAPWESVHLLSAWERAFALPGTGTLEERQDAVAARLLDTGGCSIPYFVGLGASLGYEIWIEEYAMYHCVSSCVDPLVGVAWANAWTVHYLEGGTADDVLEDIITRARPAHTYVHFERHEFLTIDGETLTIDGEPLFI